MFDELLATKWSPTPDGRIRIEGKPGLKVRLGHSPDRADAVVMALSEQADGRWAEVAPFRIV